MKALSLWQPWATLVVVGAKRFETRSWPTTYRGPLAIHATKKRDVLERILAGDGAFLYLHEILRRLRLDAIEKFPLGAIVGTCEVVDCTQAEWLKPSIDEMAVGDFTAGRFGWKLEKPAPMDPPIEAAGAQGLWTWSPAAASPEVVERGLFD
jgi:activating signal cointegrator 1